MTAADRDAVDRGDHRLRYVPDHPVQTFDLERPPLGRAVPAGFRALLHIATGTECAFAGPGQHDRRDVLARPRGLERVQQFIDGTTAERVHPVRAVDRDHRDPAVRDLVCDIGELADLHVVAPNVAGCRPPYRGRLAVASPIWRPTRPPQRMPRGATRRTSRSRTATTPSRSWTYAYRPAPGSARLSSTSTAGSGRRSGTGPTPMP